MPENLYYTEGERRAFQSGDLPAVWHATYPELFDDRDLHLARNQPDYHFKEWLGALYFLRTHGYLSLVEKYEFANHPRKQRILKSIISESIFDFISPNAAGRPPGQCPDLFVYAPDRSDWFFAEIKGPSEPLTSRQPELFSALEELTRKPITIVRMTRMPP